MKQTNINLIAAIFLLLVFACARAQAYDDPMLSFEWGDAPKGMDNFPSFDSGKSFDMPSFEMRSGAGNDFLKNNTPAFGGEAWSKPAQTENIKAQGGSWRENQGSGFAEPLSEQVQRGVDKRVYKENTFTPTFGGEAWSKPAQTENIKAQGGSWRENQGSGFAEPLSEQAQRGVDKRVYKENTFTPTFGGEAWSKPAQTENIKAQGGSWRENQGSGFAEPSYEQQSGVDKQVYKENTFTPTFGGEAWSKPIQPEAPRQTNSGVPQFSVSTYEPAPSGTTKGTYPEAASAPAFGGEAWSKPAQTEIKEQGANWQASQGSGFAGPGYEQQQSGVDKQAYKKASFAPVKELNRGQITELPSAGSNTMALPVFHQEERKPGRALEYSAKEGRWKPVNLKTAQEASSVPVMRNVLLPEQVLRLPKTKKNKAGAMEMKEENLPRISLAGLLLKLGLPLILCSGLVWVLVKEGRHILDPLKLHIAKERLSAGAGKV